MSKGWWQLLAILALAAALLLGFAVCYALYAYGSNLDALASAHGFCLWDTAKFDSIAAAQMIGRLDSVSFLLTVGGLLLGVFAFTGFWMIRREALDGAREAAVDAAREAAGKYFSEGPLDKGMGHPKPTFTPNQVPTSGAQEVGVKNETV